VAKEDVYYLHGLTAGRLHSIVQILELETNCMSMGWLYESKAS
jgi:hypothetical protein